MTKEFDRFTRPVGSLNQLRDGPRPVGEASPDSAAAAGPMGPEEAAAFRRHVWLLDVLGDLHRYAQREGLEHSARAVRAAGEIVLDEIYRLSHPEADRAPDEPPQAE